MPEVDIIRQSIPNSVFLEDKDFEFLKEVGEPNLKADLIPNEKL